MECQQNKSDHLVNLLTFTESLQMPLFFGSFESYEDEEGDDDSAEIIPLDEELNQAVLNLEDEDEEEHEELPIGFSNVSDSEIDDNSSED